MMHTYYDMLDRILREGLGFATSTRVPIREGLSGFGKHFAVRSLCGVRWYFVVCYYLLEVYTIHGVRITVIGKRILDRR